MEAEFELLTVEEAEKRPVAKGRKEPGPWRSPSEGEAREAGLEPEGEPGGTLTPRLPLQPPENLLQLVCEPVEALRLLHPPPVLASSAAAAAGGPGHRPPPVRLHHAGQINQAVFRPLHQP